MRSDFDAIIVGVREDLADAVVHPVPVQRRQAQTGQRPVQASVVSGQREGLAVDHLDRLKGSVADDEAVVDGTHTAGGIVEEVAVDPDARQIRHGSSVSEAAPKDGP